MGSAQNDSEVSVLFAWRAGGDGMFSTIQKSAREPGMKRKMIWNLQVDTPISIGLEVRRKCAMK